MRVNCKPFLLLWWSIRSQLCKWIHLDLLTWELRSPMTWSGRHISQKCVPRLNQNWACYTDISTQLTHRPSPSCIKRCMVLPYLDYCSCVWDPSSSGNINLLESVQKFAARLCTKRWEPLYLPPHHPVVDPTVIKTLSTKSDFVSQNHSQRGINPPTRQFLTPPSPKS